LSKYQVHSVAAQLFATASTSALVAVFPWRYLTEMSTANSLHFSV